MNYDQNSSKDTQDQSQQQRQKSPNAGNFKNDPARAAEAGRKGGQASHGGGRRSSSAE